MPLFQEWAEAMGLLIHLFSFLLTAIQKINFYEFGKMIYLSNNVWKLKLDSASESVLSEAS